MEGEEEAIESIRPVETTEERVSVKSTKFPHTRVRNMMKMDPDLHLASQESVFIVCKALELFVEHLAKEAYKRTALGKRKTVQKKDLDNAVNENDELAFLQASATCIFFTIYFQYFHPPQIIRRVVPPAPEHI